MLQGLKVDGLEFGAERFWKYIEFVLELGKKALNIVVWEFNRF